MYLLKTNPKRGRFKDANMLAIKPATAYHIATVPNVTKYVVVTNLTLQQ